MQTLITFINSSMAPTLRNGMALAALLCLWHAEAAFSQGGCNCANFSLINPDFEANNVPPNSLQFIPEANVPGWETTDPTGFIEIWGSGANGVPSYSGNDFAELQANNPSALFQDLATCPGQSYTWQAAHRGRATTETAVLEFGPPGGPYTVIQVMVDGTNAWGFYTGTYVIPAGQTTTQVRLRSVIPATGSVGNFVDAFLMTPVFCTTDDDGDTFTELAGDCDDNDNTIYPGAPELCDGKDNDCNSLVDDEHVAPTMNCSNITVNVDPGNCSAVVNYPEPVASDNCSICGPAVLSGYTSLGTFGNHKYFVSNNTDTWAGANAAATGLGAHLVTMSSAAENTFVSSGAGPGLAWIGFTDQAIENTFVWSNGEPVVYTNWCPGEPNNLGGEDYTVTNWCGSGSWNDLSGANQIIYVIEFDCAGPIRTTGPASGSTFPVGQTTVGYSVTDAAGNTGTCSFMVTVVDNEQPVIQCPQDAIIACTADNTPTSTGTGIATATDNCGIDHIASSDNITPGNCAGEYTIVRTWTATDIHNNTASCTQNIIVHDITAPTANCQAVTVTLSGGSATVSAAQVDNGSIDDCSGIGSLTLSKTTFSCADIGDNPVTLTVTDNCGNPSTCTAIVTVVGSNPNCGITVTPANNIYTGGVATNLYLGYGPQSATINVSPGGGSGFSYAWAGPAGLSCYDCQNPVFTPATGGTYTFVVTVTNSNGCTTTCSVTFCVKDIRVPGNGNNGKVYICHVPNGNPANANTLSISTSAVPAHLSGHAGDHLGQCNQSCGPNVTARMAPASSSVIGDEVRVYPNPNNGSFVVEIPYTEAAQSLITVTDVQGKVIHRKVVTDNDGRKITLNLGDVAHGMYMIEVTYGDQRFRTKLTVQ